MSRFNIGVQIGIGFALAVVLMAISAIVTCSQLRVMQARESEANAMFALRHDTTSFLAAMVDQETGMRGYVASGKEEFLAPLNAARAGLPKLLATIRDATSADPELSGAADAAAHQADAVNSYFDGQIALVRGGRQADAVAHLGDGKAAFDDLRQALAKMNDLVQTRIDNAGDSYGRASQTVFETVVAASLATCIAMAAFAFFLGSRIARRLAGVTNGLHTIVKDDLAGLLAAYEALEAGNLTASFTVRSQPIQDRGSDEIGRLTQSYSEMCRVLDASAKKFATTIERLRATIGKVDTIARDVRSAASAAAERTAKQSTSVRDISSVIDAVAKGAEQQVEGVQSVSTASEELARTAAQIAAGSADQAQAIGVAGSAVHRLDEQIAAFARLGTSLSDAARRANEQTSGVTSAVRETASAMTSLRDEAANTGRAMTQLEEKSAAVEEIVSTIDEIADQTNLLALNAAIEAARAGEHGRGFSVVADEVRKLAERAAASTRQINSILSEIRRETSATSAVVRSSVSSMEAGLSLASKAAEALQGVNTTIAETNRIADEVAGGATKMREASSEVTASVSSVSAVIEQNAAAAAEMRTTTDLLTSAMLPIANLSVDQSTSATRVAQSAQTLAVLIEGTSNGAQALMAKSEELAASVDGFTFEKLNLGARGEAARVSVTV